MSTEIETEVIFPEQFSVNNFAIGTVGHTGPPHKYSDRTTIWALKWKWHLNREKHKNIGVVTAWLIYEQFGIRGEFWMIFITRNKIEAKKINVALTPQQIRVLHFDSHEQRDKGQFWSLITTCTGTLASTWVSELPITHKCDNTVSSALE